MNLSLRNRIAARVAILLAIVTGAGSISITLILMLVCLKVNSLAATHSSDFVSIQLLDEDTSFAAAIAVASMSQYLVDSVLPKSIDRGHFEFRLSPDAEIESLRVELSGDVGRVFPVLELTSSERAWYTGRLIAKYRDSILSSTKDSIESTLGCYRESSEPNRLGFHTIRTDFTLHEIPELCDLFMSTDACSLIVPEIICQLRAYTDTLLHCPPGSALDLARFQWTIHNRGQAGAEVDVDIDATHAWVASTGNPNVAVAVIDYSFDSQQPRLHNDIDFFDTSLSGPHGRDPIGVDLQNRELDSNAMAYSCDQDGLPPYITTLCSHGTACLGIMAGAHNGFGINGIAPRCTYYGLKFGTDFFLGNDTSLFATLEYAFELGIDIISISVGSSEALASYYPQTTAILHELSESGVLVFAASGNSGGSVEYPALLQSVIAVGATDERDSIFAYTCRDSTLDFVAPSGPLGVTDCPLGGSVPTWDIAGIAGWSPGCDSSDPCSISLSMTCSAGGTSMACPTAAGVAALVLSFRQDLMDHAERDSIVLEIMKASARDVGVEGPDDMYGFGRVDARRALAYAALPGDPYPDGVRDVLDVVLLNSVAFRGLGCLNLYYSAGDLNCDSVIDILDVVRIVNVVFRSYTAETQIEVCKSNLDGPVCCPPTELLSPPDYATGLPRFFDFVWEDLFWAESYRLQVDDAADFASPLLDSVIIDAACHHITGLDEDTRYYWRVVASGNDCVSVTGKRWQFTTGPSETINSTFANAVHVESKEVLCGALACSVGVYLSNGIDLNGIVLPLELKSTVASAYIGGELSMEVSNRLENALASCSIEPTYLPNRDASNPDCSGMGYFSRGDFTGLDGQSPDAMLYMGLATDDSLMLLAGADGEPGDGDPSIVLTFDIGLQPGVFEIDTACVTPANHLAFVDAGDWSNPRIIVPEFTKGVVTVGGIGTLSGHVTGHDTLCCNVVLDGDVIIDTNASLTLLPGRTVMATAFHDTTNGGLEPDLVEIIVYGTLQIADGSAAPPLLTSDSGAIGSWYGIRMMPGCTVLTGPGAQLEYAYIGVTLEQGAVADSVANLSIRECDLAGIWSFGSDIAIAGNTIADIEEGYGICVWDADPLIRGNRITACETGIDVLRSSATIRGNAIYGPGLVGINVSHFDELYYGLDTTWIVEDSILGYFSGAHVNSGLYGHCRIDSCELISQYIPGGQSPYGIKAVQTSWGEVRYSKIQAFGAAGLHSYKSDFNLGRNGDQGYNDIQTDSTVDCEDLCIKRLVLHIGVNSTDTLKAEGNWWDSVPPPWIWFSALVDRTPYLTSPPLGKIVADIQEVVAVPEREQLGQNYPNPFNPSTTVSFSLASPERVTLIIYNTLGQQIKVLADAQYEPGSHQLTWDGRTEDGRAAASGVYFYRLVAGEYIESRKMVLLK